MKPSTEEINYRRTNCVSERLFNRILRNFIMCTILSVFTYKIMFDGNITFIRALICYGLTSLVFYVALLLGQIPFLLFDETSDFDQHPRAPQFYSDRNKLGRILIAIIVIVISFFSFFLITFGFN